MSANSASVHPHVEWKRNLAYIYHRTNLAYLYHRTISCKLSFRTSLPTQHYYSNTQPRISHTHLHKKTMPRHHVHWPDDLPSRHRLTAHNLNTIPPGGVLANPAHHRPAPLTRDNLDRVPIGGDLANPMFRRPHPITRENLDQVPGVGFYAGSWGWHADEVVDEGDMGRRRRHGRDRRGDGGWRRRV